MNYFNLNFIVDCIIEEALNQLKYDVSVKKICKSFSEL